MRFALVIEGTEFLATYLIIISKLNSKSIFRATFFINLSVNYYKKLSATTC